MTRSPCRDKHKSLAARRLQAAMTRKLSHPTHAQFSGERDAQQHWSVISETLAPVNVLLQYLNCGWTPQNPVTVGIFPSEAHQIVKVYYFVLARSNERPLWIPVLANPIVARVVADYRLTTCEVCLEEAVEDDLITELYLSDEFETSGD